MRLGRREFLKLGGATAGVVLLGEKMLPAAAQAADTSFRTIAVATVAGVEPSVRIIAGLSEFIGGVEQAGGSPSSLLWIGQPASPSETIVLLTGFQPSKVTFDSQVVAIEGTPDDDALRVEALPTSVFYPYALHYGPVVETRTTPRGIPYQEVEYERRTEPVITTEFVLFDAFTSEELARTAYTLP